MRRWLMARKNHPRLEKYGSGPPDQRVVVFMESLSFNWRLYQYDIQDAWGMFAEPMLELARRIRGITDFRPIGSLKEGGAEADPSIDVR
jgi:hypothetical protein